MFTKKLEHFAIDNAPSVYDEEALTALELAGRTALKVNECIEYVDGCQEKAVETAKAETKKHIESGAFDAQLDEYTDNANAKLVETIEKNTADVEKAIADNNTTVKNTVDKLTQSVTNSLQSCKNYVDAEVKQFDRELTENTNAVRVNRSSIDKNATDIGNLNARVNNLLNNVPEGSTTLDAELIDVRKGGDNVTYGSAGDAVRGQVKELHDIENSYMYMASAGKIEIYAPDETVSGDVCIKFHTKPVVLHAGGSLEQTSWDVAGSKLGSALYTDGDTAIITVPTRMCLVWSALDFKFYIKGYHEVGVNDVVILSTAYAQGVKGEAVREAEKWKVKELEQTRTIDETLKAFIYLGNDGDISILRNEPTGQISLWCKSPLNVRSKNKYKAYEWSELLKEENLGDRFTIEGEQAVITLLQNNRALVFNLDDELIYDRNYNNVGINEIPLIVNAWANPIGGVLYSKYLEKSLVRVQNKIPASGGGSGSSELYSDKITEFSKLFNDKVNCDSFLFFTDPHIQPTKNAESLKKYNEYMDAVEKVYRQAPFSFVCCGGDWLDNNDTQTEACKILGYIGADMKKRFDNPLMVVGNHDTNYQGRLDGSAEGANDGRMTDRTILNLWGKYNAKTYSLGMNFQHNCCYSYDTENTRYIVASTGTDWEENYQNYLAETVADQLVTNTKDNVVIIMHIAFTGNQDTATLDPRLSSRMFQLIHAFNIKQSIYLDDNGYDFVEVKGQIRYVLSGHTHFDHSEFIYEGNEFDGETKIPFIATTNLQSGGVPTFDMVFNDWDNKRIYLKRIGTGEDRVFYLP